jgi:sulfur carrier protein
MRLMINGEPRDVDATTPSQAFSVDDLLQLLQLPVDRVAVEHNGSIVRKAQRAATTLHDGDRLELVTLVGGG